MGHEREGDKLQYARLVFEGYEQTEALRKIGETGSQQKLHVKGSRWRRSKIVEDEIQRLRDEAGKKAIITREECIKILADHARGSLGHFIKAGENGDFYFDLDEARSQNKMHLLEQVELEEFYVKGAQSGLVKIKKFKLHSVQGAIDRLAKLEGWNAPEKVEAAVTFADFMKKIREKK